MLTRSGIIFLLGTLLAAQGPWPRPDLDAGRYLKVLADADARIRSRPDDALALAARSQALAALVRLPEALAAATRATELEPRLADALLARAMAKSGMALRQRNLGSLRGVSDAMNDLRAAVAVDPTLVAAWMALGVGYEALPGILGGSTRKALECAEALRSVNPGRGAALRGTVLAMEGRWKEAQEAFGTALGLAPSDPELVYAYLDALGLRETRKAVGEVPQKRMLMTEARRLSAIVKGRARALTAVCDALIDAGLGEEAWKTALADLPGADAPSLLRLELGKIAARSGIHREEGLVFLEQVLREPLEGGSGGYATAQWRRGQILKDLGRIPEARAAARAALAIEPNDAKASGLLKSLN